MKFFILAIILAVAKAGIISTKPKHVTIRNTVYEEEVLKTNVTSPHQLVIDHDTNTLFFSYTANLPSDMFKIAYLNLKTTDYGLVDGINGGFANAVDSKSNIVYMGGNDGVYKFDYDTKTATNLNLTSEVNIWQMFYKNRLYFTTYPEEKVFTLKTIEFWICFDLSYVEAVPEFKDNVTLLAVKNDGSFLYYNSTGLFTHSKTNELDVNIGDYVINAFTSDIDGNIYFSTPSAIFYVDDKKHEIEELFTFNDINGVAIEGNGNIIYASANSIIRLKPTTK